MRRRLLRATLLFLLATCMTTGPGFLSPAAHALPGNGSVTTHYSDSTHRTVVGEFEVFCGGKSALMGRTSPFFTTVTFVCPLSQARTARAWKGAACRPSEPQPTP